MDIDQIAYQIETSPTVRLLRSDHASLALSFFFMVFKKNNRLQVPFAELSELLEEYLTHLRAQESEAYPHKADHYLNQWCDDKHRFLRKYYEIESDEPVTELTYDTERSLEWMWSLEAKEFIGTQSRFLTIFENMERLASNANTDPETRIQQLKTQRRTLDAEIKNIQATGAVPLMDSTHIRERFLNLIEDSRRLISDFRLVEDIFQELTHNVKTQKLQEMVTKGDILSQVLDSYEYLEESDQGKSFEAFWNFLISAEQQEKLKQLTDQVLSIPEIQDYIAKNPHRGERSALVKMKHRLLQVGHKVLRSKHRLSEELRKLLHQQTLHENKQVNEYIHAIKKLALDYRTELFKDNRRALAWLDFLPHIYLPMERPLWQPKQDINFKKNILELGTTELNSEQNEHFDRMKQHAVDMQQLNNNIATALETTDQISLNDLLVKYPIKKGSSELVAYLKIATQSRQHVIDTEKTVLIHFSSFTQTGQARLPHIIYCNNN